MNDTLIRRATESDLPVLGRLGAMLLQIHFGFDPQRFVAPGASSLEGYAWFLGSQLNQNDAAVFVAEDSGSVIGYVYAGLEPQSWKELREPAGFIHDVAVDESNRKSGVATRLMETALEWLHSRGAPRVILWTAEQNHSAARLFSHLGFRRTMIEMTRELP